jgi:hypothetical protein
VRCLCDAADRQDKGVRFDADRSSRPTTWQMLSQFSIPDLCDASALGTCRGCGTIFGVGREIARRSCGQVDRHDRRDRRYPPESPEVLIQIRDPGS